MGQNITFKLEDGTFETRPITSIRSVQFIEPDMQVQLWDGTFLSGVRSVQGEQIVTAVNDVTGSAHELQAFPNPFTEDVCVTYHVEVPGSGRVEVFDAKGRHVKELFNGRMTPGEHVVKWDGTDGIGPVAAGTYACHVTQGGLVSAVQIVVLR